MSSAYNYVDFVMAREEPAFDRFRTTGPFPGERAENFGLEDLETGAEVELKSLWAKGPVIIEFGAFT